MLAIGKPNYALRVAVIAKAVMAERERCAKIAGDFPNFPFGKHIAAAIRKP